MKKTTKGKTKPFTCVIHGAGIDIDIKIDSLKGKGSLDKLGEAIAKAIRPPMPMTMPPEPSEMSPFSAVEATEFAITLSDIELETARKAIVDEQQRRNDAPKPGSNH